jgi:tetratricopeptide (TPR) repeat protein
MAGRKVAYTLVQASRLAGLSPATARLLLRAGVVKITASHVERPLLTLDDVMALQSLGALPRRVLRAGATRLAELAPGTRQVRACGGRLVVSDSDGLWDAESGQRVLALDVTARSEAPAHHEVDSPVSGMDEWLGAGIALLNRGQIARAAALFRRGSRRWPLSPQMHLHYGIVLERLRRWRLARRAYEQAIALDAQLEEAYRLLALMLIDRGDAQAAIRLANALRRMQRSREPRPPSA